MCKLEHPSYSSRLTMAPQEGALPNYSRNLELFKIPLQQAHSLARGQLSTAAGSPDN